MSSPGASDPDRAVRLRSDRVLWREVRGEIVALSLDTSDYLTAKGSANEVWELLEAGTTPRDMARALGDRFSLDERRAEQDVEAFLEQLSRAGLLQA